MPPKANVPPPSRCPASPASSIRAAPTSTPGRNAGRPSRAPIRRSRLPSAAAQRIAPQSARLARALRPLRAALDRQVPRPDQAWPRRGHPRGVPRDHRPVADPVLPPPPLGELGPPWCVISSTTCARRPTARAEPLAPNTIRWIMAPLKAMLADAYENGLVTVDASPSASWCPTAGARGLSSRRASGSRATDRHDPGAIPERYRCCSCCSRAPGCVLAKRSGCNGRTSADPRRARAQDPPPVLPRQVQGVPEDRGRRPPGGRHTAPLPRARPPPRGQCACGRRRPDLRDQVRHAHQRARRPPRPRPIVKDLALEWARRTCSALARDALRDAGLDANAIARVLGHSDPSFTQRTYIHEASIVRFDELLNTVGGSTGRGRGQPRGQPAGGSGESRDTPSRPAGAKCLQKASSGKA